MRVLACSALVLMLLSTAAQALWAPPDDRVPTARLIKNLEKQLAATPEDPHLLARLGRIYSLRYALGEREVGVIRDKDTADLSLYEHGHGYPAIRHSLDGEAIVARFGDLLRALDYYERAAQFGPDEPYIWLGLGYVRDEMAHATAYLATPQREGDAIAALKSQVAMVWEDDALLAYERAMKIAPDLPSGFLTPPVGLEAARYIKDILEAREKPTRAQKALLASAQKLRKEAALRPRAVTPIIFSLKSGRTIDQLLASERTVSFDLDGTQSGQQWPWVQPDTALLVWDGDGKGDVPSGRQLIGSVTWWLFWEHGYAVLEALDNDSDGWLRGAELKHLSAWQDWNSNGVSDAGEVRSLYALGVEALAATVTGHVQGMPMNQQGVMLRGGGVVPSYDWIVSPIE